MGIKTVNGEWDLSFLQDVLKKRHVRTSFLSLHDTTDVLIDSRLGSIVGTFPGVSRTVREVLGSVESATQYRLTSELGLKYIVLRLPVLSEKNLLFIGPFLSSPFSEKDILELGERLRLSLAVQKLLREYYAALPIVLENDCLFTMIDAFCERLWKKPSFAIVEIDGRRGVPVSGIDTSFREGGFDDALAAMEMMEMRYAYENEILQAVTMGQQHKEKLLSAAFNERMFEARLQDPVRNAKNYCIIMNTLLRKAAEKGGVHPIYIDRASSGFAAKIEQTVDIKAIPALMREMFSSYCRLVRKHAARQYSPPVQKAVLIIDSDISAELSLRALAEKQGITPGYLATVFKKETGKTVSEFVRERRVRHAVHLLTTTGLQVQTVAMHCGIMDVQYFSKLFKRHTGKTPKEYRMAARK